MVFDGEAEAEIAALTHHAIDPDASAMGFNNLPRDDEAKARPRGFLLTAGDARKFLEELAQMFRRDAWPRIAYHHVDLIPAAVDAQGHRIPSV